MKTIKEFIGCIFLLIFCIIMFIAFIPAYPFLKIALWLTPVERNYYDWDGGKLWASRKGDEK